MSASIAAAIQNGSFPDSEEVLASDINSSNIPPLLHEIQLAKEDLTKAVSAISKESAADVSGWIEQAKKVQADIARCKEDYQHIILEHTRIEALRAERNEARTKTALLEDEILFNETLQEQIRLISETSNALNRIDVNVREAQYLHAAQALRPLTATISSIPGDQSRSILSQLQKDLTADLSRHLENALDSQCVVTMSSATVELAIHTQLALDEGRSLSLDETLDSMEILGSLADAQRKMTDRITPALLPFLYQRAKRKIAGVQNDGPVLRVYSSETAPPTDILIQHMNTILHVLYEKLPNQLSHEVFRDIAARVVPRLIVDWLDPAIPSELDQLPQMQALEQSVRHLAAWLREVEIKSAADLEAWVNQISRTWLDKRKATSLDAVRTALKTATGTTRKVERTERRPASTSHQVADADDSSDDWAENWAEDDQNASEPTRESDSHGEDGSDAWGFGADEQESTTKATDDLRQKDEAEEEGDAWGWGDEEDTTSKPTATTKASQLPSSAKQNGVSRPKEEDLVLMEEYTITDIPDSILEQIGKDIADHQTLQSSPQTYFASTSSPPPGMTSLPTLVLAMFRASAPDHYTSSTILSRLNLYNDTLYIAQKLSEDAIGPSPSLRSDLDTLSKFARQTYTSELSTQRTILHDLLDNAQGFTSCTVEPYLSQCEAAIASTTDYLRSLHAQWSKILSPSHCAQSIGSLLSSIMSKMIKDIEDMEDISEAQSQKLLHFMQGISKLEDLFVVQVPGAREQQPEGEEHEGRQSHSTIALHVPAYFRFQYLAQILEGSLADIKDMWTNAGLSIEFSVEEVIDLIEALFAESTHRRSAIQVIKSGGRR